MGDPRREGGGILTREETRDRLSFSSSSSSVSNVRSKGREASSFPGCDKRSNINSGTKAGGRGLYWIAVVMPEIARSPWPERVVPGEERGVMCLSCARIYCSCCF